MYWKSYQVVFLHIALSFSFWSFRYPLVLITMFNAWDFIARYIPLVQLLKIESRKGLMIAVLSRFLLIPAYYFTAKYGDQGWMIILTSFLGISNGYLTVCILTIAPKGYKVSGYNCSQYVAHLTFVTPLHTLVQWSLHKYKCLWGVRGKG